MLRCINFAVLLVVCCFSISTDAASSAKSYPGDKSYPSAADWAQFNRTINGNLLVPRLRNTGTSRLTRIAAITNATIATVACGLPRSGWEKDPTLIKSAWWAGIGCPDCPAKYAINTCALGNYPNYIVKAMSAQDVSAAVKFANQHNLRLVIKNSGHDFLGRNLGFGSLSIWTWNLRGIRWDERWIAAGSNAAPQSAVIYGAGEPWKNIYSAAYSRKKLVTGGTSGVSQHNLVNDCSLLIYDQTVGAGGGWVMGGGHGFFTNRHGLGVDNVLEFQVVTPAGAIVTANARSNSDLFWALRGGGGSTFGVVTRVTMKAHPPETLHGVVMSVTPGRTADFPRAVAYILSSMPAWSDWGLTGYPIVYSAKFNSLFTAPGKSQSSITSFLTPYSAELQRLGCRVTIANEPDWENARLISMDLAKNAGISELHEGDPFVMGSRLLGRQGLRDRAALEQVVRQLFAKNYVLEPFNVGGGAVAANRNLDIALNPAWRDAIVHFSIIPLGQVGSKTVAQVQQLSQNTQRDVALFDSFSVNSAAYANEVSWLEPEWQKVMWGTNYPRLLSVKRKYDPNNTLWCFPCVGSEAMQVGSDGKLYSKSVRLLP